MNSATFAKLMETLERANIEFIGQSDVEINTRIIKTFQREVGFTNFFDDIFDLVNDNGKHILRVTGVDETKFMECLGQNFYNLHTFC